MKRYWFPLVITLFHVACFYLFPNVWGYVGSSTLLLGALWYWWRTVMLQTATARTAAGGLLILTLLSPLFIQIFEVLMVRYVMLGITIIVTVLYQHNMISLIGHIRTRSPFLLMLLTTAHAIGIGMVGVIATTVGSTVVQNGSWWIALVAVWYGIMTGWYYRGLKISPRILLPSVMLQTVMAFEMWWILMMLPFAPLTKTLMGLLPLLYLTYAERDRLLMMIDEKQLRRNAYVLVIVLIILSMMTRWS